MIPTFETGGLALAGLIATAAPIVIHLLMKPKPKPMPFPALMLLTQRKLKSVKQMRVQNLLLLLARMALLLFLGLALARPTLKSDLLGISSDAPIGAVMIIDTSRSMEYEIGGKDRLDLAQELSQQLLKKMPDQSKITVIETGRPVWAPPLNIANALSRVDQVEYSSSDRKINESILIALNGLKDVAMDRKEIYIFSDMSETAWNVSESFGETVKKQIEEIEVGVQIYGIDVSVENPKYAGLGAIEIDRQVLSSNSTAKLKTSLFQEGEDQDVTVQLSVNDEVRDTKPILAKAGQKVELEFQIPSLDKGIHQGKIEFIAEDPTKYDNTRYFTLDVQDPVRVLVVADDSKDALNIRYALAPREDRLKGDVLYDVQFMATDRFEQTDLNVYRVIIMTNVGIVSDRTWLRLTSFVQQGGGLLVSMGDRIQNEFYNTDTAQKLLPSKIGDLTKPDETIYLTPERFDHPALQEFQDYETNVFLIAPILKYIVCNETNDSTSTILKYTNNSNALIERSFGQGSKGRCTLFTSSLYYRPSIDFWSEFPLQWPFLAMMNRLVDDLAGLNQIQRNFISGTSIQIQMPKEARFQLVSVTDPDKKIERYTVDADTSTILIPKAEKIGHFLMTIAEQDVNFDSGFSVNLPESESFLTPVESEKLTEMLGEDHFTLARDPEEMESQVTEGRVGRELFKYIMLLVLIFICAEGYLSNRFYRTRSNVEWE